MFSNSLVFERLISITNTLNQIIANSKRTEELPEQTNLVPTSLIRVSNDGVSQWLEIQKLINSINGIVSTNGIEVWSAQIYEAQTAVIYDDGIYLLSSNSPLPFNSTDFIDEFAQGNWIKLSGFNDYQGFTTYFIDKNIADSTQSKANDIDKPFKTIEDVKAVLPEDDGGYITLFFISSGVHQGTELPCRNIIWNAQTTAEIDFTGINEGDVDGVVQGSGAYSLPYYYHFLDGKITLKSSSTAGQAFGRWINPTGYLGGFDWSATSAVPNADSHIFRSRRYVNLRIGKYYTYNTQGSYNLGFANGSDIIIEEVIALSTTLKGIVKNPSGNLGAEPITEIHKISLGSGGKCTAGSPVIIGDITGTGDFYAVHATFKNSNIAPTVNIASVNIRYLSGKILTNTPIKSNFNAGVSFIIENFEGHIEDFRIDVSNQLIFKGVNNIKTSSVLLKDFSNNLDLIVIENGITNITTDNPSDLLINNASVGSQILCKGELITNAENIGAPVIYGNNTKRGIDVYDENGIMQFRTEDYGLQLEGGVFNSTNKSWKPQYLEPVDETTIVNPETGSIIFSSNNNKHKGYDGSTWNDLY